VSAHHPIFDQYLGVGKPSGGEGEFRYVCPFCKEREPSFAINFVRKRFICFKGSCNVRGDLTYLASKLGFTYDDVPLLSSTDQLRHRLWAVDTDDIWEIAPKLEEPIEIPELIQIVPTMQAWDYLINRGLTPHDIYYNELSLSPEDRLSRIYFPHRDETGEVCFWVRRTYLPGARGRKYHNPGGAIKKRLLYRSNLIDRSQPVSICEGPLSAIAAGNAVATLGVLFSKEQVEAVAALDAPILSAMDGEAFTASVKLARMLEPYGVIASVVPMPRGYDPADLVKLGGREAYQRFVDAAFTLEPGAVSDVRERASRLW